MDKPVIYSPLGTYVKLGSTESTDDFLTGLKEFLKTRLTLTHSPSGIEKYSCGMEHHHNSYSKFKRFKNFEEYCEQKGYDPEAVHDLIEERLGRKVICECEIVNDVKVLRRARLRQFGFDPDEHQS